MDFTFFATFVPHIQSSLPIVIGYEQCSPKTIELIKAYPGQNFIHSGNWWGIDPKKRTRELVLSNQEKLYVPGKTIGFMSMNVPASLTNYEYWNLTKKVREKALHLCLDNANWALEHRTIKVPIYCSLEVSTYEEAKHWFGIALDQGHDCFCRGVAEFLRNPKIRKKGIQTIFELIIGARLTLGDKKFHLSGLSSFYLLPIVAYLGATSVDGSTPVTSALARGTVYLPDGRGAKVSNLKNWNCSCEFCSSFKGDLLHEFNTNRIARVYHNLALYNARVTAIQSCHDRQELAEYIKNEIVQSGSKYFKKRWEEALQLEMQFLS
ncbi:MAG: hypothetical protein ACTSRS_01815 [Candidatus Helarchaeota archaeon]